MAPHQHTALSRRTLLIGLASAPLAACGTVRNDARTVAAVDPKAGWYKGSIPDGPFDIPLVDRSKLRPELARQTVPYPRRERPGTIVVDVNGRFLYLVEEGGTALRYGVGVGQEGFSWTGQSTVSRKRECSPWTPPKAMLKRKPELPDYMDGGPDNRLGARALYLGSSLYRIHGTNEPWSIGERVSSGCIRLLNEEILDLYDRVPIGTPVIVSRTLPRFPESRPESEPVDGGWR